MALTEIAKLKSLRPERIKPNPSGKTQRPVSLIPPTFAKGMGVVEQAKHRNHDAFLDELKGHVIDPIHKRLLQSYIGDDPLRAMEQELDKILLEVLSNED